MNEIILNYFILCICAAVTRGSDYEESAEDDFHSPSSNKITVSDCWMSLNTPELFKTMDQIDDRYAKIRRQVQNSVVESKFDDSMIKGFVSHRGIALRELFSHHHPSFKIPSGINLGGYCILRMSESILFFHRMKLRNNTFFRINYLENNLENMMLTVNLSLNDLHLKGAYERSLTDSDPSTLIYAPTFGEVEFLLKDVTYKMEGRYRLIKNRLLIEIVTSKLEANDILMTYINQAIDNQAVRVQRKNLGAFMTRLKTDLDKWLKDYFNDVLINEDLTEIAHIDELAKYDKEKETALEEYMDNAITRIVARIQSLNADAINVADFTFKAIHGLQMKLYEGVILGLDSMYRRSVATGTKNRGLRKIDAIVGFSNLKLIYKYEAVIPTGVPPLTGVITLSANELTAHLSVNLINNPETVDLDIECLDQMKPESLTVEGAANIMISNFKHLLEHQIIAIMSSTLNYGVRKIKFLPRCVPFPPGQINKPVKKNNPKKPWQINDIKSNQYYDNMSEHDQPISVPNDSKNDDESSSEYKAALRSTKQPQTTADKIQSNVTKGKKLRKKFRKSNRKNLQEIFINEN